MAAISSATDQRRSPRGSTALLEISNRGGKALLPYFDGARWTVDPSRGEDFGDRLPSEVFNEHVLTCFIDDRFGVASRDFLDLNNVMWECDYPHTDTTWPDSQSTTAEVLKAAEVSDAEAELITHGNAERVFRWKMAEPA